MQRVDLILKIVRAAVSAGGELGLDGVQRPGLVTWISVQANGRVFATFTTSEGTTYRVFRLEHLIDGSLADICRLVDEAQGRPRFRDAFS